MVVSILVFTEKLQLGCCFVVVAVVVVVVNVVVRGITSDDDTDKSIIFL